jgi:hypothetical protein
MTQAFTSSSAITSSTLSSPKKLNGGGKGSWEFRFFALVSSGGDEAAAAGALDDALSKARGVTGVDLSSKRKCGTKQRFFKNRASFFVLFLKIDATAQASRLAC